MKHRLKEKNFMKIFLPLSITVHLIFITAPVLSLFENTATETTVTFQYNEDYKELPRIHEIDEEKRLKNQPQEKKQTPDENALRPETPADEHVESDENYENPAMRYHEVIKQKIEDARQYPFRARQQKIEGIVNISFNLRSDGTVWDIRIIQSSGMSILDTAAVDTIKKAAPFPAIPDSFGTDSITLRTSIVYQLN